MVKKCLYLAGGGARGAYQAGVLKAMSVILRTEKLPFEMISGVSVGSLNAAILAEYAHDFPLAVEKLEEIWGNIHCEHVFEASNYALSKSIFRNVLNIAFKQQHTGYLLNNAPLVKFISRHVDFNLINSNIEKKHLEIMEVVTHCYETEQTISFYHSHPDVEVEDWHYPRHLSQQARIILEHILASSSLPLFFPTTRLNGLHFGDGSIGLVSPLRGAIRFHMEKVLILGTRHPPLIANPEEFQKQDSIGFASVLGSMLNGLFLDNLDRDIELVNHMNDIARLLSLWKKRRAPWRPISTLYLRPSVDISSWAQQRYHHLPILLRTFLNGLGAGENGGDLLSFLLFEKNFARELIQLGYQDTLAREEEVKAFFL